MLERDGDSLYEVMSVFSRFIGDLRLVFYNAPFDYAFLRSAAHRFDMTIDNPISDALDMMRRAYPNLKSYKLVDLAKMSKSVKFDTKSHHRAINDCILTMHFYGLAATELGCIS